MTKPRLWVPSVIAIIALLAYGGHYNAQKHKTVVYSTNYTNTVNQPSPPPPANEILLSDTNQARAENSLPTLKETTALDSSAKAKCDDMITNHYFAHNTPDGRKPWVFFDHSYSKMGENLSEGYQPDKAVDAWLHSPSHRANILDPVFNEVGFAVCSSNEMGTLIVQHFAHE